MANKKLSELAEKANLPTNALIHILDPNDLTQSPQGSDFKFDSTKLIPKSAIVDNLLSTSTTSVLSGNQGRILNENSIDNLIESKEYADSLVIGLLDDRGNFNASSNLFPSSGGSGTSGAVLKGDLWTISVEGTLGGTSVTIGDMCRALSNNPEQISSNWNITETNLGYVSENSQNKKTTLIGNESSNLFYSSIKAIVDYFTSSRLITILGFTPYNATNPSGFTANSTDAQLRDRSTHTGTQLSSTISDIQSTIINNSNVLDNTAKITNATHTGDVTGSAALTLANVNSNLGTFNNITVNAKGLVTAANNVAYASGNGSATGTNTGDNATNSQYSGLASSKENTITAGTTAQYFRGDKTFQTLNSTAVGLGNVDNTTDLSKPISTATQTALDLKENSSNKSTATALGTSDDLFPTQKAVKTYVDASVAAGAADASTTTKGIIQLAGDLAGTAALPTVPGLALKAPIEDPTFTGTVSGIDKSMVGLADVDNTTDADKPVSTATSTALDLKANLASPTFTGTVVGITSTMVGLGSVDNTTDALKPVSTATQTALNLKANLAGGNNFTGNQTALSGIIKVGDRPITTRAISFSASLNNFVIDNNVNGHSFEESSRLIAATNNASFGFYDNVPTITSSGSINPGHFNGFQSRMRYEGSADFLSGGFNGMNSFYSDIFIAGSGNVSATSGIYIQNSTVTGTGRVLNQYGVIIGNLNAGTVSNRGIACYTYRNFLQGLSIGSDVLDTDNPLRVEGNGKFTGNLKAMGSFSSGNGQNNANNFTVDNNQDNISRLYSNGRDASTNGDFEFYTTRSNGTNQVTALSIKGNGNVGINQTNPTDRLDVVGNGKFSGTVTATSFNGSATLTGSPTAPTAATGTNTNQIATTAFVVANAGVATLPYKVYTALLSQSGNNAPVATVLQNTLGGTVVWSRLGLGGYNGTLSGAFTTNKTTVSISNGWMNGIYYIRAGVASTNVIAVSTFENTSNTDSLLDNTATSIEIRVYN